MKTNRFVYEGKVRNILVVEENNEDVYGYDLDSWSEEMKKKLETSFRHFKKNKIKTPRIKDPSKGLFCKITLFSF